jgi:hemerythrin
MIQWDPKYETGEENIDEQHRILFSHLDLLENVINEGDVATQLPQIVGHLKTYVSIHFGYEELCMFRHKCPVAEENKAAHKNFKETIPRFENRMQSEGPTVELAREMHEFLEAWLKEHICKIDVQLRPCLRDHQRSAE